MVEAESGRLNPLKSMESQPDSTTIWVFTPSRNTPDELEAILVQRRQLLEDAVERVRESALTGHKHHQLFVGPRGSGKTFLASLIVHRAQQTKDVVDRLRVAWLNEDETCTTLLEFLLKIHAALGNRYPNEFPPDAIAPAYEMPAGAAQTFVGRVLLEALASRTVLVVVENLDALFETLGKEGQHSLRAFIQENPRMTIVATAQRLVEDLSSRAKPFFGFFQTEYLKPLNLDEATELLRNIARMNRKQDVVEFLDTRRGRSRIRALHHLSGGNHRIYIVLSHFITKDSIDALVGPFMKMVDELTPYYQERIRWLSPLQRRIVELLCRCEGPVPVKELAKRLFGSQQTISRQLQELREKGYVEANARGREMLYEVSEPLMRICVEVKENSVPRPLRLLVDFLRAWYEDSELTDRLLDAEPMCVARAYLESALDRNREVGSLRKDLLMEDYQQTLQPQVGVDEGQWQEGFSSLVTALDRGSKADPKTFGSCVDLVGVLFSAGLSPTARQVQVAEMIRTYARYQALPSLGEGLIRHIGNLFRKGAPFPSTDNLVQWQRAWEQGAAGDADFQLPLRLLRVGIAFVSKGGADPTVLLELAAVERSILRQALRLEETE
jgi:DNA-binding transcriptional ArsR family regulator